MCVCLLNTFYLNSHNDFAAYHTYLEYKFIFFYLLILTCIMFENIK